MLFIIYIYISSIILIRILAQLVERSFYTRKVIGSNPIFPKYIYRFISLINSSATPLGVAGV